MNTTELCSTFRLEMSDSQEPYLWQTVEIIRFIDEAEKMFCRLTEGIEDAQTAAICNISIAPAVEWYLTDRRILKLRSVTRADTGREVPVYNIEHAPRYGVRFDGRTGTLAALINGMSKSTLRAWPIPNETVTVKLAVFRLPLVSITDLEQTLEIDEQHHYSLLMWMKHLAYGKQDAETFDRTKQREFELKFREYCVGARNEQSRARRSSQPVAYGGI